MPTYILVYMDFQKAIEAALTVLILFALICDDEANIGTTCIRKQISCHW